MSQKELSKEQPLDAQEEPAHKDLSTHDSDNESSTDPEDAVQCSACRRRLTPNGSRNMKQVVVPSQGWRINCSGLSKWSLTHPWK